MSAPRAFGQIAHFARVIRVPCVTGKLRHASEERAAWALRLLRQAAATKEDPGRIWPSRVYRCPQCGDWHLTHRGPRRRRATQDPLATDREHQRGDDADRGHSQRRIEGDLRE